MNDLHEEIAYWEAKVTEAENLIQIANRHLARLAMNGLAYEFNNVVQIPIEHITADLPPEAA